MSDSHGKKKALGRGLSALLDQPESETTPKDILSEFASAGISEIPIDKIDPNPFQPRVQFSETELAELTMSIIEHGIIQPITVRRTGHDRYQVIAGERRLKACRIAGHTVVPAYIRIANDEQMLEMALVENIQRQDLNPLEIAISFQRLLEECRIRQEDLSQKVGKDRSTISNYIRLLKLPAEIQVAVRDNLITMGHARAIINIDEEKTQLLILQKILEQKLSVRQVEEIVRKLASGIPIRKNTSSEPLTMKFTSAKKVLKEKFGSKVDVRVNPKGAGSISIAFKSEEDFDRIFSKLRP